MERSAKESIGMPVLAGEEKVGNIRDLLFSKRNGRIRHLDIEKGKGLHFDIHYLYPIMDEGIDPKRLLVEPGKGKFSTDETLSTESLVLSMSEEQFAESPGFSEDLPVERQYEYEFNRYLGRPAYDRRPKIPPLDRMAEYEPPTTAYDHSEEDRREHIDRIKEIVAQDLHSAAAIIGYEARSADQKLGEVVDLVFDDSAWNVLALVISSEGMSSEEKRLELASVEAFDWSASVVRVSGAGKELPRIESGAKSARGS